MTDTDLRRFMSIPETVDFIRVRYQDNITRAMVYRRAWQGFFKMHEERLDRPRLLIETQSIIERYEHRIGITPVKVAEPSAA
jgi:hypothetical protein